MKNPVAKDLHTPKYKMRVVKPKKGKGSFKREKNMSIEVLETSKQKQLFKSHDMSDFKFYDEDMIGHRTFIVKLKDSKIVGIAALNDTSFYVPNAIGIAYVEVLDKYKNQGVATEITQAIFERCISKNKNLRVGHYEEEGLKFLKPVIEKFANKFQSVKIY